MKRGFYFSDRDEEEGDERKIEIESSEFKVSLNCKPIVRALFFFFSSNRDNYRDPPISGGIELFLMGECYGSPITREASSHTVPIAIDRSPTRLLLTRASYHFFFFFIN